MTPTAVAADADAEKPTGVAVVGARYWGPNLVRKVQGPTHLHLGRLCDLDLDRTHRLLGRHSTVRPTEDLNMLLDELARTLLSVMKSDLSPEYGPAMAG